MGVGLLWFVKAGSSREKLGACLFDHNYKHVTNMYAPVIEIVVAMVIKAPHPPSLWSDSGVSAEVVDREVWTP